MTYFEKEVRQILETANFPCERYPLIRLAKSYMDDHYTEPLQLEQLSAIACISKYHFLRLFASIYQTTPYQYLMQVRMREARKLILAGHSTTDACYRTGFSSPGTFRFLFQRHTKRSPANYRRRQLEWKAASSKPACSPFFLYYQKSNM